MPPSLARLLSLCFALLLAVSACAPPAVSPPATARPAETPAPAATAIPSAAVLPTTTAAIPTATLTLPPAASTATLAPAAYPAATGEAAPAAPAFPPAPAGLSLVAEGLKKPVDLAQPADDSGRLFVVEQAGLIRIWRERQFVPEPFLDLQGQLTARGSEQGLLGLAFHPQYRLNGRFFVYYTDVQGDLVIARYTVDPGEPDRADPGSAALVLRIGHPSFANHNGGQLAFGPDGYLYIGVGDGGSGGDPRGNGQNLDTLLGKLLRVDVDADPYAIPPGNPFLDQPGKRPEIWAYGLRNPWRFSFDRATGDLYIADVGQNIYEEVNYQAAGSPGGANFGWNLMEGLHPFRGAPSPDLTLPVTEYAHAEGGCSVTGGYVYRGAQQPQWAGLYIFGDFCSGLIWALGQTPDGWQRTLLLESSLSISSFGQDQAGEIYALDHRGGAVYQLAAAP